MQIFQTNEIRTCAFFILFDKPSFSGNITVEKQDKTRVFILMCGWENCLHEERGRQ